MNLQEISKTRKLNIDIIRIVAAWMVLIVHTGFLVGIRHAVIGQYGVPIFFALSGYLGFCSYSNMQETGIGRVKAYYKKRVFRIIPEYYFALILYAIYYWCTQGIVIPFRYFACLQLFIPSDNFSFYTNMGYLWTISTFMLFYLLLPIMFKVINSIKRAVIISVLMMAIEPFVVKYFTIYLQAKGYDEPDAFAMDFPFIYLYCFIFGAIIFMLEKNNWKNTEIVLFILGFLLLVIEDEYVPYRIVAALIVGATVKWNIQIKSLLVTKIIVVLSKSSFLLYMLHQLFTSAVTYFIPVGSINKFILFGIICSSCVLMSIITYFLFEQLRRICRIIFKAKGRYSVL